ncbi:glycoside hydrolase family 6 protein [Curtobacterium pusillum]|uniref:glycoside hydrolase family 6 protein n=1 Tax=Curtobacterium pusillum TaxID=69373 RepID=UPI001643C320|nr:glycoside hydrolase family 6 protein [Curtobacterium pusillum]
MHRRPSRTALVGTLVLGAVAALVVGTAEPVLAAEPAEPAVAAAATRSSPTTASAMRAATAASLYGAGPYRSPTSEAAKAAAALAGSDPAGAAAATTIARYPVATWLGDWTQGTTLAKTIDAAVAGAEQSGTTAVFVTYAIPDRDCGGYSAGGFDETTYDAWVDQIAARLAGHPAAVIVEPDSLAMLSNTACSTVLDQQRFRILSREVAAFTAAGVPAYLDAGNSNWVQPAVIAARLDSAGVRQARGFFTNVANYYPTAQEQAYAQKVSAATGGSHYVIDTSRNGQGWRGTWCNGPGAGLGTTPRVVSDGTALDALLWVKTPGASDGTCQGGPTAGTWFSSFAQTLVAKAQLGVPTASTAPRGAIEVASGTGGGIRLRGWAFDEDDPTQPVTVRVSVDGKVVASVSAGASRPDVDTTYGVGATHGFDGTVPVTEGVHSVCVTAVDLGAGDDTGLGCRSVRAYRHDPYVALEAATVATAGIAVRGWAFDGDAAASASSVAVRVDGRTVAWTTANGTRTDVGASWGAGAQHGFTATVAGGAGRHTVCVVARNTGAGADRQSTPCRTLTVPASAPVGHRDAVTSTTAKRVSVQGWTFDRDDTRKALTVRVTVDGRSAGTLLANRTRADVDRAHGGGPAHGFSGTVAAASGKRSVCLTAVGVGSGGDRSLGCSTVAVR